MSAMAELTSQLSIVPHMRFSRSTFLRNTEPRSRGAPFFARPRASVTQLTKPLRFPLYSPPRRTTMSIWHREEDMGPRATRFALVFWMALAVAVIILAIKPWAGARDSQSKSAAPIPAREIIYQPQHWKVF
jgi:hypothetical protein